MSASSPTQLNIVITQNASGTVTTSTIVIAISAALQSLDSANSTGSGVASGQTGYSSVDVLVRSIFRANGFTDGAGTWYPREVIQKITAS